MAVTMDGIFVNGQKATFRPEDILSGDASAYTEEIGTAVESWMEQNVTGGEQVTDTTLTLPGVPADAKVTGDKFGELKEDLKLPVSAIGIIWNSGYYDTSSVIHGGGNNFFVSNWLPCWEGTEITICCKTSSKTICAVVFADENNVFGGMYDLGEDGTEVDVTIPDGAVWFRIGTTKDLKEQSYCVYKNSGANPLYNLRGDTFKQKKTISELENQTEALERIHSVCYVDSVNGNDNNDGTKTNPFATINKAISSGYRNLMIFAGFYAEAINIQNEEIFTMKMYSEENSFDLSEPNRKKVVLFRGMSEIPTNNDGVYTIPYTPESGSDIYKVFVTHEIEPTTAGSYALTYNANAFLYKAGFDSVRLMPVLPEAFNNSAGTFTYENNEIKFVPFERDVANIEDTKLYVPTSLTFGMRFRKVGHVELNDVVSLGNYFYGFSFEDVQSATINGCEALCTTHGSGFRANNANIDYENCKGCGNQTDGFGFSYYGDSVLTNCYGLYNADDGCSHHHGCKGVVSGGVFLGNGSGGVTPAFGASVNINNIFSKGNRYGIALFYANGYPKQTLYASGCTLVDNTDYDIYNDGHDGIFSNCVYSTETATRGTNTFYGN